MPTSSRTPLAAAIALTLLFGATVDHSAHAATRKSGHAMPAASSSTAAANPFFQESPLEFGFPQFDKIKTSDYALAFDRGMAVQKKEVAAIANNPAKPTFDNTILAMEKSGRILSRATYVFSNLTGANTSDDLNKLDAEYSPKFAAHRDSTYLNAKLFQRIKTLYNERSKLGLDAQGTRLVERYYEDFKHAGADLTPPQKERVKAINAEVAGLQTKLTQNVLAEANASAVFVDNRADLAGLGDEQIQGLADDAKAKGQPGKFRIALVNTTGQPLEAQLENRALRQKLHEASVVRGSRGGEFDNTALISRLMKLRAERAEIMGYPDYASFALADETAKNPQAVNAMLDKIAPIAVANARKEGAVLQAMIDKEQKAKGQPTFQLEPWDWAFYTEKVRKAQYDYDENEIKPYLEFNNVLNNGVFFAAHKLYGLSFKRRTDLPVYQEDVQTYDVFNEDGSKLAIIIVDPYARASKQGGAWMSSYVDQSDLMHTKPVVAFHLNVTKPTAGKPSLMTWDDVNTAFHEFGHVLHGMFSNVKYPYFSGTNVPRDFVEYPSQVNEMWTDDPAVLANYAKHWQTGQPLPKALLDKVMAAAKFNEGFKTTEYLGAAMLDQKWHQIPASAVPQASGVVAYEVKSLKDIGLDYAPVPPRYRTTYFKHIMEGYAAGYYAYIWSEVLDADTAKWIHDHGGLTRANGDRFRSMLLSRGGSVDAMELFEKFYGGKPDITPLLERRGLVD